MDTSPQAGSSNVTVEYTDPSGLFPLVQPIFENKLPLKNLHWKSPSRPVRSIESLRIGFVPTQDQHGTGEQRKSNDATTTATTKPVPHRRHQIPGLRQTPYLKIFLLKCDDNDTYKASARKAVREWIKTHASTPQAGSAGGSSSGGGGSGSGSGSGGGSSSGGGSGGGSNQEKHDAFEWLILHVEQDGDGNDKAPTTSKWGQRSTTVLEKLKADFNGSSKTAVDRVAQLRLPKPGTTQKPPELADQVEDLVEKIKNAILMSFDHRVAQYEDDIKEKDSQRSLPGWNFCTFFILKEGLARGFENVGLFEDALAGYDELSVGLDIAIHEQLEGSADQHGSALSMSSKDWKEHAQKALESISSSQGKNGSGGDQDGDNIAPIPDLDASEFPFDSNKKPYREMILASDISIFDFRVYVFSRQLMLLLRAARAPSLVDKESPKKGGKPEDLMLLSEICERASEFIALAARTLRYDLEHGLSEVDNDAKATIIDNIVSSWTYAAATQMLFQTQSPNLTLPESIRAIEKSLDASTPAAAVTAEIRPDVPKRASSLVAPSAPRPPRPASQDIFDVLAPIHRAAGSDVKPAVSLNPKTGSEQLASGRGALLFLARRTLEDIAGRCGWKESLDEFGLLFDGKSSGAGGMADISLDDSHQPDQAPKPIPSLCAIDLAVVTASLKSRRAFQTQYEELTDQMFRHYIAANRPYSAEMAITDIALLRYRQENYTAAASHFHQIAPFYGNKRWTVLEGAILEMYTRCLKELKRSEEYVRLLLRLLAKFAAHTQANLTNHQQKVSGDPVLLAAVSPYVDDLFESSGKLQKDLSGSLLEFFADLRVDPVVLHYPDRDGFQVQLYLRFLLSDKIDIDAVKVRLVSASGQSNEQWIETSTKSVVRSSSTRLLIDSSSTLQGKYFLDRIEMRSGNIVFTHSGGKHSAFPVGFREALDAEEEDSRPYIYCYPPPEGLQAKVVSTHHINLEENRTLELELNSGRNDIKAGTVRVRPATAGLRLRIAEAELVEGEMKITANNEAGNIEFVQFGPQSFVRFRIPYTVEENHTTLSARAEVSYETQHGKFSYTSVHSVVSALPISVNVQDMFKDEVLFSRFTISPAMQVPLRVLGCSIPSSEAYQVECNIRERVAWDVFPKQPASLLYKIQPRKDHIASPGAKRSLRLTVEFTCVDDECLDAVGQAFRAAIDQTDYRGHTTFLTSHLVEAFRTQLTTADMEVIGLTREIETLPYQKLRWDSLLSLLGGKRTSSAAASDGGGSRGGNRGGEEVEGLKTWLQEWHEKHPIISLPQQPTIPSRRIVIPVDIPEIQVVHTAELRLLDNTPNANANANPDEKKEQHEKGSQLTHAAVGQMIAAELRLHHTRRWCSPAHQETTSHSDGALEFTYDLHANPEQWLIGGRRRGNFLAREGTMTTFAVMLLPQKSGHLLLPSLDIKAFVPAGSGTGSSSGATTVAGPPPSGNTGVTTSPHPAPPQGGGPTPTTPTPTGGGAPPPSLQRRQIACEVDYRNHGEALLVLPDLRKTTVTLSVSGGSWLVDSERRV